MSDNNAFDANVTIGTIASEILGSSANPTLATAILNWEITQGAQLGVGVGLAVALADMPITVGVAIGMAAGYLAGQASDYLTGMVNQIAGELQAQANIMGAVNLDGAGLSMPDPVTGMGYY